MKKIEIKLRRKSSNFLMRKQLKLIIISLTLFSNSAFAKGDIVLEPVIVTASPLGRSASKSSQPITVISGDSLIQKLQPTIGETLSQELGIRSTYYGPNSSRPIIRGLDGDQIEILQNGISNIDVSATSADHNLSIDPLSIETIEILRGPSALLYGPKAGGGVINLIDNRIPKKPIPQKITGFIDGRSNSSNQERSSSILLEGGFKDYAFHINGFQRVTDDLKIESLEHYFDTNSFLGKLTSGEKEIANGCPFHQ